MRITNPFLTAFLLIGVLAIASFAQTEAGGGGGGRVERTGGGGTTFKTRARPVAKRVAPKRIAPKKTAAEYEAEGNTFYDQKDYDSALVAYENAAKLKPSYNVLYRIGFIYNDFGEYAKSLPALDRAIAMDGSLAPAFTEKGYALRRLKRTDEAVAAFTRSISLNSKGYVAPYELGSYYNELKRYAEAEGYLKQSIANKSDNADAYAELGNAQRQLGRNAEAINSFKRAISLDPEDGSAYIGLGDAYYYGTSDYQNASAAYAKGLEYDDDNQGAAFNAGYAYNDLGKYNEALQYLGKSNKLKPNDYDTYVEMGYAYLKLNNGAQALASYQRASQLKPNGSAAIFGVGDVSYEIDKKYSIAASHYQRGLAIAPNNGLALYRLGYCYNDMGRLADAVDVLSRALKVRPKWVGIMNELGYAYKELKRYDDAISVLRQAVSTNRDSELAHYYLGQSYAATHNRPGAMTEYRELQRLNSQYASKLMDSINKM